MELPQREIAMHEAGHLVMHAKIGKGYADKVWIGKAEAGYMTHHDHTIYPGKSFHLGAVITAGGLAVEAIRGRPLTLWGYGDWINLGYKLYNRHDDEIKQHVVDLVTRFLREHWFVVEYTADFIMANMNKSGFVGKRALRILYDEIRLLLPQINQ